MGDICTDNTSLASGSSGISSSTCGTINGSSTSSTNTRKKRGPPGPIDNSSLIAPVLHKVHRKFNLRNISSLQFDNYFFYFRFKHSLVKEAD